MQDLIWDLHAAKLHAQPRRQAPSRTRFWGAGRQREYLVKWVGRSHMHNEWVGEALLARIAKRKLVNFQRRENTSEPCMFMQPAWRVPERFVARRPNPASPGWQVLVKWSGLGYDHCSWEVRIPVTDKQPQQVSHERANCIQQSLVACPPMCSFSA